MPTPKRLQRLLTRLERLEAHLLPAKFSLTGRYSPKQKDLSKAFLLLIHAELESYFEDRARSIAVRARSRYQRSGLCTPVLSRLVVCHHATEKKELASLSQAIVEKAVNHFLNRLEMNHGIKEQHLRSIFLPLGLNHSDLNGQLTAACNQLSHKRGDFAHASFKTHQQVDPLTERNNIRNNILPQLKKLEKKLHLLSSDK